MIILFFLNMVLLAGKMAKFTAGGGGVTLRWTSIPSRWGGGGGGERGEIILLAARCYRNKPEPKPSAFP